MPEISYVISPPFTAITQQQKPKQGERGVVGHLPITTEDALLRFSRTWSIPAEPQRGRYVTFREILVINSEGLVTERHPAAGDPRRITRDKQQADIARKQGQLVVELS